MNCCSAPKPSRPLNKLAKAVNEKHVQTSVNNTGQVSDFKSLSNNLINHNINEKTQLLSNQLENSTPVKSDTQRLDSALFYNSDSAGDEQKTSTVASTSNHILQQRQQTPGVTRERVDSNYGNKELNFDDDDDDERGLSESSSIDVSGFREVTGEQFEKKNNSNNDSSSESHVKVDTPRVEPINIPSTTKIGDYARLEYSPVEDLESAKSEFGLEVEAETEGATQEVDKKPDNVDDEKSEENDKEIVHASSTVEVQAESGDLSMSRRSSQGIESTSISISSQLSNEQQLQHNLTNMLESAQSTNFNAFTFETIGLPLGPSHDPMPSETAKTSPETTGAALTSASQDSLSNTSMGSGSQNRPPILGANVGAALVQSDSFEPSYIDESAEVEAINQTNVTVGRQNVQTRLESSMSTTNPTPTPSELSGTSSQRKKRKLRAKNFFKKLKPGGSKKIKNSEAAIITRVINN